MSTVTLQLNPETERKLRAQANLKGQTIERYLERLAEEAITNGATSSGVGEIPRYISNPQPTDEEFDRLLKALASGPSSGHVLPPDFSRADIYDDHD